MEETIHIQNLDSDVSQPDARIVIYPSIIMAVTVEDINEYPLLKRSPIPFFFQHTKYAVSEEKYFHTY